MNEDIDSEVLEWRDHDSSSQITHTGYGPYMVEGLSKDSYRAWLPDDSKSARLKVDGFSSHEDAVAFCQRDVDGRRTLDFIADAEKSFDSFVEPDEIEDYLRRMRVAIPVARVVSDGQPNATATVEVFSAIPVGTVLYVNIPDENPRR